jgi:ATPase family AAA domain-containing protein 2
VATEQVNGDVHVNGTVGDAQEPQPAVIQIEIDGVLQAQAQVQTLIPPRPKLYDMDLERIHNDLYKNRYLTPNDFLYDIRKIVHNAQMMEHDDPDRRYKAEALLTAAEVSMHEFDPQMRLECERMAHRERKRRDERSKERERGKGKDANGAASTYAPGTRRSTRNNGQHIEVEITDPVLLERRLKRQRSGDGTGDSQASGSEASNGPSIKRSRMGSPDDLDLIGPRVNGVRFADDMQSVEPTPSIQQVLSGSEPQLTSVPPVAFHVPEQSDNPFLVPTSPQPQPSSSNAIASLLNPTSPMEMAAAAHILPMPGPIPSSLSTPVHPIPGQEPANLPKAQLTPPPSGPSEDPVPPVSPAAMEVEREPTPLPDFIVDEAQVDVLKAMLVSQTGLLNIEQLEQLRATCLGVVWRHRADWDRAGLVKELTETVQEFVEEVGAVDADTAPVDLNAYMG